MTNFPCPSIAVAPGGTATALRGAGLPDPRSVDDDDGILNRRPHRAIDERGAGDDRHAGLLCLRDEARERKADHQRKSKAFHTSSPMQTVAVRY